MDINALGKIMKNLKPIEDNADKVIQWYCIGTIAGLLVAALVIGFAFWLVS